MRQHHWRKATLDVFLRPGDQLTIVLGLWLMAAALSGLWTVRAAPRGGLVPWRLDPPLREAAIDPNRADWPELTLLPGVGKVLGQRIVQTRQRRGLFAEPEELQRVKGIGPAKLRKMRDMVWIEGDPPERGR